ncbi:MAG: hypothetical protein D6765_01305 [Bacteroidetes bacterium]|nr:MAG: hypothetical protein D6765_01305 [Bacteroidota bacterium]
MGAKTIENTMKTIPFLPSALLVLFGVLFFACGEKGPELPIEGTTPHGYRYLQHTYNEGPKPQPGEYAYFHLVIRQGDRITFNSFAEQRVMKVAIPDNPASSEANPSPIVDVLPLMSVQDSFTVFHDLQPNNPASRISYHVRLTDIKTAEQYRMEYEALQQEYQRQADAAKAVIDRYLHEYNFGNLKDSLSVTDSGLRYLILEPGSGPRPVNGSRVSVHYYGAFLNGEMFDNSYTKGVPFGFVLGQGRVIKGWDEGFLLLNQGAKALFFIPPELGYGKAGYPPKIPGDTELLFYVELLNVSQ